ncbi:LD-carboxypeptidase [uncultured Proteiniphilum sp.]|uniref:S66 peptidase family protein n=1 Tax=uncultured Proteiniphilum sp. TaxID=497637 RepID=UPI00260B102F|nr:LD-carboxypeptidase [uncultured Proteiniphilum sp.]
MKRPPSLQFNDRAVILSPAGKIDGYVVQDAAAMLESWGLRPEISENALCDAGRFSGSIEQRLSDLQKAFDDPAVRLVLCSRGGYGTAHLLGELNFSGIKRNPKWVVGYSDITILHAALQAHGIASLHGPMAQHFSDEGAEDIAVRYTKIILAGQPVSYHIPVGDSRLLNREGSAVGRVFGGNLSVFCGLLGTKYARIPRGGILFIEDIGEAPYRVDRMIYQLELAGVFRRIGGLIVGRFTGYEEDSQMYFPLQESIREAVNGYDFPLCFNFPVGHVRLNFPLIMGATAVLTVEEEFISFRQ